MVRKTILFLIPTLTSGGAERVVITLLRHLDRQRFAPVLAVVNLAGAVFLRDIPEDVELVDLGCQRVRYALPKLFALIWRRKPAVVFSTLGYLNLSLAIMRPLLPRDVRYIARESTIVSHELQHYSPSWLWSLLYRVFYCKHDLVVCQSRFMQADLVQHYRFPAAKSVVIPNPLDITRIRGLAREQVKGMDMPSGTIHLLAVGRLSHEKGFDLLLEAVALLDEPRIQLTLVGEGGLLQPLQTLAKRLGMMGRVHFAGFQANPYAWLARADAFVLSSHYEGFPNVVLEALACQTPVIATPAPGGLLEILDGVPGCVVAQAVTAEALAAAIALWLGGGKPVIHPDVVQPYALQRIIGQYEAALDA